MEQAFLHVADCTHRSTGGGNDVLLARYNSAAHDNLSWHGMTTDINPPIPPAPPRCSDRTFKSLVPLDYRSPPPFTQTPVAPSSKPCNRRFDYYNAHICRNKASAMVAAHVIVCTRKRRLRMAALLSSKHGSLDATAFIKR